MSEERAASEVDWLTPAARMPWPVQVPFRMRPNLERLDAEAPALLLRDGLAEVYRRERTKVMTAHPDRAAVGAANAAVLSAIGRLAPDLQEDFVVLKLDGYAEKVVSLEGFGIAPTTPDMAPERYRQWLGALRKPPRMHVYADRTVFARRLRHMDRFLTTERANFLAKHLARVGEGETKNGERRHGIIWNGDPWHKAPSPYLFHLEESMAIWKQVTCPVLWVAGRQSWVVRDYAMRPGDWEARRACFAQIEERWVEDTDHMLHHDQPAEVARLVESFLG